MDTEEEWKSRRTDTGPVPEDHIDKLAKKYLGKDKYPFRQAGEKRVILKILPEHLTPAINETTHTYSA
jgi:hypothetical protein